MRTTGKLGLMILMRPNTSKSNKSVNVAVVKYKLYNIRTKDKCTIKNTYAVISSKERNEVWLDQPSL
jgi:hypothetical protein